MNAESGACYQGQTHGHKGFLLTPAEAAVMKRDPSSASVVHAYITGDDLLGEGRPTRYVIDISHCDDLHSAIKHKLAFQRLQQAIMSDVVAKAEKERESTKKATGPRQSHARRWWRFWRGREEMLSKIRSLPRYIACSRVTRRPIFEFIDPSINPNDAMQVFPLADDYSFGILQSNVHWDWFTERCSTLKADFRYTSDSVFDSFPWPQSPTLAKAKAVAEAARELRATRRRLMQEFGWSLRELYKSIDVNGTNALEDAHDELDAAVRAAYGMKHRGDSLKFLFELNQELADKEAALKSIVGPGLPPFVENAKGFISNDRIVPFHAET